MSHLAQARLLALLAPAALLGGAFYSQYFGGLHPCEMCYWQRWPHEAAVALALLAYAIAKKPAASRLMVVLAGLFMAVSGAIGVFHAGVEYGWWEGLTTCARGPTAESSEELLKTILSAPIVRCDQAQWQIWGVSLAGFNAVFSFAAAIAIWTLSHRSRRAR